MSSRYTRRGNYRPSQESDQYHSRAMNTERMRTNYIGDDGCLLFGAHKGLLVHDVPVSYIEWAKTSIAGFAERLALFAPRKPSGASLPSKCHYVPERASEEATGPSEDQERAWRECDVDDVPSFEKRASRALGVAE